MKNINLILIILLLVIESGCSPSTTNENSSPIIESSTKNSYKALLFVNGKELQTIGKTAEELGLVPKDLIGVVKEKVNIELRPKVHLTSNYLEEETEIYSVVGNTEIVLAKKGNGELVVFE